jgi:hypothetical protein
MKENTDEGHELCCCCGRGWCYRGCPVCWDGVGGYPGAVVVPPGAAANGQLTPIAQVDSGQAATCWVIDDGTTLYTSNAGSGTESGFADIGNGALQPLGNTATDAGTVDATATPNGQYVYTQAGANGNVDEYRTGAGGTLTEIGSVIVPGAVGGEGIVAL